MGAWRNLALYTLYNPDKVPQSVKDVLYAKWQYEITHPKKKSGLTKVVKGITGTIGDVIHTVGKVAGNLGQSSINVVKETAKGNIGRAISNAANVATVGTVDATGGKNGIINIHATKYINALSGGIAGGRTAGAASFTSRKGLLTQIRAGKGTIGGGSYSESAKNPLGGLSGKMGK